MGFNGGIRVAHAVGTEGEQNMLLPTTQLTRFFAIFLFVASLGGTAQAQDKNPPVLQKHYISNAVQLQFTLRGQKYFETHLQPILDNMGMSFNEGYFEKQTLYSDKPINLSGLKKTHPEAYNLYVMGKDLLTKWFVGFTLTDHRPAVEIGNSGYQATFSKFALLTDEALMKSLGKTDGAVMAIDLEITQLAVSTKSVRAWDINNFSFAKAGLDDTSFVAGDKKIPLKIRLPFYVRVNSQGVIEFKALDIQENFQQVPVVFKYKNLIVPKIAIEIEGQKFALNTEQLQSYFDEQLPTILVQIRKYLSEFSHKQLPEMLNSKAKESMAGALEQVQTISAPGQATNDFRPPFLWGLKLTSINLKTSLNLGLAAYAEDSLNPNVALIPANSSRGLPNLSQIPAENFDIALSIDRGLINRMLQLSFLRKNFEEIKDTDGSVLKLKAAPTVDYIKPPATASDKEAFLRLGLSVEIEPNQPLWLDKTVIVSFDMIAKMKPTGVPGKMALLRHSIDTGTLKMDSSYLTFAGKIAEGLGNQVTKGIKKELALRSQNWAQQNEKLADDMDLPPSMYGVKFDVNKLIMDPNGHLVMYLNYSTGDKQ